MTAPTIHQSSNAGKVLKKMTSLLLALLIIACFESCEGYSCTDGTVVDKLTVHLIVFWWKLLLLTFEQFIQIQRENLMCATEWEAAFQTVKTSLLGSPKAITGLLHSPIQEQEQ
jgi:hypothetical protein